MSRGHTFRRRGQGALSSGADRPAPRAAAACLGVTGENLMRTEPRARVLVPRPPPVTASATVPLGYPSPGAAVVPTLTASGLRQSGKDSATAPGGNRFISH